MIDAIDPAPATRCGNRSDQRGGQIEHDMTEVRGPSRMDAGAPRAPRLIYVVTEDWYFLSPRLPMARAARAAGFEVHVATRVDRHGDAITAAVIPSTHTSCG